MANEPHIHPCLFWDDNSGPLNISLAYKDNTGTWQVNADIVTDADPNQFINQHNRLVYMTDGEYGIVLIENTSFDLELWQEGTTGWSADGTFTLTDDDTSENWTEVDIRSLQNGFHGVTTDGATDFWACDIFPDGVGTWVLTVVGDGDATIYLSVANTKSFASWYAGLFTGAGPVSFFFMSHDYQITKSFGTEATIDDSGQIIIDDNNNIWVFSINAGVDLGVHIFPTIEQVITTDWDKIIEETIVDLTGPDALLEYKVSVRYADNTLHVVTLEKEVGFPNNDYFLRYYRRDQNGWSTAMDVDTWTMAAAQSTNQDARRSVQITVDNSGNILLFNVEWDVANARGDLQVWELPFTSYDAYTTGGNWNQTTNIDGGTDDILGCSSLNIHP